MAMPTLPRRANPESSSPGQTGWRFAVRTGDGWPGWSRASTTKGRTAIRSSEPILTVVIKSCNTPPHLTPRMFTRASDEDQGHGQALLRPEVEDVFAGFSAQNLAQDGVKLLRTNGCQGRDGAGADDPELDPAPQEPGPPAIALAEEDVVAAGPGVQDRDLGECQCSQQGQHAAQDPDERRQAEVRDVLGHGLRLLENARADDRADDDGGRRPRAQGAHQAWSGRRLVVVHGPSVKGRRLQSKPERKKLTSLVRSGCDLFLKPF